MGRELWVEFLDERFRVQDQLTFGRRAELVVDPDNPYLHRITGTFLRFDGGWWLRNDGTTIELAIRAAGDRRVHLPPGTSDPLYGTGGVVRVVAGGAKYEIKYEVEGASNPASAGGGAAGDEDGVDTAKFGVIKLNAEQRLLLAGLAESRLREPTDAPLSLPNNSELAHSLGWSSRKLDRKLDYICRRLSESGVPGLRGLRGSEANYRRQTLVEHVLAAGLIDDRDLEALDEFRRSASGSN